MSEDGSEPPTGTKKAAEIEKSLNAALAPRRKVIPTVEKVTNPLQNSAFTKLNRQNADPFSALAQSMKNITGPTENLAAAIKNIGGGAGDLANRFQGLGSAFKQLNNESTAAGAMLKNLSSSEKWSTALKQANVSQEKLSKLFATLQDGRELYLNLTTGPDIKLTQIPPNPIHKTNDRLLELDTRMLTMTSIMEEGVKIASALQTLGLENAKTSRWTIRLSIIAAIASIIAIIMPFVQQHMSAKEDQMRLQAITEQINKEFTTLRAAEQNSSTQITTALEKSEMSIVNAVETSSLRQVNSTQTR